MTTTYMGLTLPEVSVTEGPTWATYLNTLINTLDAHTHESGSGQRITQAGINITDDLSLGNKSLTSVEAVSFYSNSADVSGNNVMYDKSGDLYFTDGSGNSIRITSGGALNVGSVGGIGGDYTSTDATCFYTDASLTYFFQDSASAAAKLNIGGLTCSSVTSSGALSGTTLTLTGALTGTSATFSGTVGANALTSTTSVSAATLTLTGAASVNSLTSTTTIGCVSLTASGAVTGATLVGTLTTAAQTNITSVGALNGGSITSGFGNIDVGSSSIDGGTITADTAFVGTLSTAAQPNITSVGTLTSLAVSGTATASTFSATTLTGTLSTAAQTNVTSLGTLTSLTISGGLTVDTDTLVVDATNDRVGVNNATPLTDLDVSNSTNPIMRLTDSGSTGGTDTIGRYEIYGGGSYNTRVGYLGFASASNTTFSWFNDTSGNFEIKNSSDIDLVIDQTSSTGAILGTSGYIKVIIGGVTRYIQLYTTLT